MEVELAVPMGRPSLSLRLWICALVLLGQVAGFLAAGLAFWPIGFAAHWIPALNSRLVVGVYLFLCFIGGPILGSWVLVKRYSSQISPEFVAISSISLALALFAWANHLAGGVRQALGAVAESLVYMLPLVSVLGSFLASYIPPRGKIGRITRP